MNDLVKEATGVCQGFMQCKDLVKEAMDEVKWGACLAGAVQRTREDSAPWVT